jgi:hypothetical protein
MYMCRGRELDVPSVALDTLAHTRLRNCKRLSSHADEALKIVEVCLRPSVHLKDFPLHTSLLALTFL